MKKYMILLPAALVLVGILVSVVLAAIGPGSKAPDFTLPTLSGSKITLSDVTIKQGKVVVLDIWATWCGPCRGEIPYLINLHKAISKDGATVIGAAIDMQSGTVAAFAKEKGIPYPVVLDPGGRNLGRLFGVSGIPATFIIDKHGVVRYTHTGFPGTPNEQQSEIAQFEKEVRTLLAEK